MEDLSSGVSITDLTLTDFRIDLAQFLRDHPAVLEGMPLGARRHEQHRRRHRARHHLLPGAEGAGASSPQPAPDLATTHWRRSTWPMWATTAPRCSPTLRPSASGPPQAPGAGPRAADLGASSRHDKLTRHGEDMRHAQKLLGPGGRRWSARPKSAPSPACSSPGGTYAMKGEFAGASDF